MTRTKTLLAAAAGLALMAGSAQAASIQFDAGDNAGLYVGTNAPGHLVDNLGALDTSWNEIIGDKSSGFVYSDGTTATGITVDFGRTTGSTNNIGWDNPVRDGGMNPIVSPSIYDTVLQQDNILSDGRAGTNLGLEILGMRVKGLAAGTYTVYALVSNTQAPTRTYDVGIGTDTDDTTKLSDLTVTGLSALVSGQGDTSWVDGQNYASTQVTVTSPDDWIVVIVDPTNDIFGSLTGLQIVEVPEPGSLALLAAGGLCILRRRRA